MKPVACLLLGVLLLTPALYADQGVLENPDPEAAKAPDGAKQCIVWSSGDRDVALKLVFMYAFYSKTQGWMDTVRLLVWGPSAKLLSVDLELQQELQKLKEAGVELLACKACADSYGVSDQLSKLGIEVRYTGKDLADMQKTGWHVLTF